MQVNLSSGGYHIIDSGQTFLFGLDENLEIDIIASNGFAFSVILNFYNDTSTEYRIEKEIVENKIKLSCYNFIDVGTGLDSPVNIATVDGKQLYLLFWSYLEGKGQGKGKVRTVKYTIFYEK